MYISENCNIMGNNPVFMGRSRKNNVLLRYARLDKITMYMCTENEITKINLHDQEEIDILLFVFLF